MVPGALGRGLLAVPRVLGAVPGVVAKDFAATMARYPRLAGLAGALGAGGRVGVYAGVRAWRLGVAVGVTGLRMGAALFTPLRFAEIAELGYRGAWAKFWKTATAWDRLAGFRKGYVEYMRSVEAAKGLAAAGAHGLELGVHGGEAGAHAGTAGLHEPQVAPVLAGMHWDQMLTTLEKMPPKRFQALIGQASAIAQPVMALTPVIGHDATAQTLRTQAFAPLIAVAYTLEKHGTVAAQVLAGALAKELGAAPLHGLAGGMRFPEREMVPAKVAPGEMTGRTLLPGESSDTKVFASPSASPPELADRLGAGGIPLQEKTTDGAGPRDVIHFDSTGRAALRDQHTETDLVRLDLTDHSRPDRLHTTAAAPQVLQGPLGFDAVGQALPEPVPDAGPQLRTVVQVVQAQPPGPETHFVDPAELGAADQRVQVRMVNRVDVPGPSVFDLPGVRDPLADAKESIELTRLPDGGYEMLHVESGLRMVYDARGRWVSREIPLVRAAQGPVPLRVAVTRTWGEDGTEVRSYQLEGDSAWLARFHVEAATEGLPRAGRAFVATDRATGHRWHYYYDDEDRRVIHDVWVGDSGQSTGLGYLRYDSAQPQEARPSLVDTGGAPHPRVRVADPEEIPESIRKVMALDGNGDVPDGLVLVPAEAGTSEPLEHVVVDGSTGRPLQETLAERTEEGVGYITFRHPADRLGSLPEDRIGDLWLLGPDGWSWSPTMMSERIGVVSFSSSTPRRTRPALGAAHGQVDAAPRDERPIAREWLMGPGTLPRLAFGRNGVFTLDSLPGSRWVHVVRIARTSRGLELFGRRGRDFGLLGGRAEFAQDFAQDAEGLTVRMAISPAPDAPMTEYRWDMHGRRVYEERPLPNHGIWEELSSARVAMRRDAGNVPGEWRYELVGPSAVTDRFRVQSGSEMWRGRFFDSDLGRRLAREVVGSGFVIHDTETNVRRYASYLGSGEVRLIWEVELRYPEGAYVSWWTGSLGPTPRCMTSTEHGCSGWPGP
jgi:hypothetical protein